MQPWWEEETLIPTIEQQHNIFIGNNRIMASADVWTERWISTDPKIAPVLLQV